MQWRRKLLLALLPVQGLNSWTALVAMGKKARAEPPPQRGSGADLAAFAEAVQRQLSNKQRLVRAFDVGGTGVKTALVSSSALRELLCERTEDSEAQLEWIERPQNLGEAPGEEGFAAWLLGALPRLRRELDDSNVVFGVSTAGDLEHSTGLLHDWWSGGGHPRQWGDGRPSPHVADLMGLPRQRTFAIHDGSAHLLGSSRSVVPPPCLATFAIGTGIGFGITDSAGALVDSFAPTGLRSHLLNGVPLSGARYNGIWKTWPQSGDGKVDQVMEREFAGTHRPWSMPWVSLVLGRRGIELAEAAFDCPAPSGSSITGGEGPSSSSMAALRAPAVRAYGEQWLHFLQTQFVPQFTAATRRHRVDKICFAGRVGEENWETLREVLLEPDTNLLRASSAGGSEAPQPKAKSSRGSKAEAAAAKPQLSVLPLAPHGSGLIGAAVYALAGAGGAHMAVWTA